MRSSSSSSASRMTIGRAPLGIAVSSFVRLADGQRHRERRSFPRFAARFDGAAVTFRYSATNCQTNPGSFVLAAAVEALEHREDALRVLLVEADSVVLDRDPAAAVAHRGFDAHEGWSSRTMELQ